MCTEFIRTISQQTICVLYQFSAFIRTMNVVIIVTKTTNKKYTHTHPHKWTNAFDKCENGRNVVAFATRYKFDYIKLVRDLYPFCSFYDAIVLLLLVTFNVSFSNQWAYDNIISLISVVSNAFVILALILSLALPSASPYLSLSLCSSYTPSCFLLTTKCWKHKDSVHLQFLRPYTMNVSEDVLLTCSSCGS